MHSQSIVREIQEPKTHLRIRDAQSTPPPHPLLGFHSQMMCNHPENVSVDEVAGSLKHSIDTQEARMESKNEPGSKRKAAASEKKTASDRPEPVKKPKKEKSPMGGGMERATDKDVISGRGVFFWIESCIQTVIL